MTPAHGRREARCPVNEKMLRVSDADRDAAISELGEHFQAGRLDPAELEDRTGRALRARIGSDLDELLADLPRRPQAPARPQPPARRRPALVPFAIPLLVAAGLTAAVLTAASGGGWHHQWALGWALWWVVPVLAMRMLWWRRFGGARPWR
jgi:uncharacterized protein DUF1707